MRAEQCRTPEIVAPSTSHFDRRQDEAVPMRRWGGGRDYWLAGDEALAATRVNAGVAAILTSTSLTGFRSRHG